MAELNFKRSTGIDIVSIVRGDRNINIPDGSVRLYPLDHIVVVGSDEEISALVKKLDDASLEIQAEEDPDIALRQYLVDEESPLKDKQIKDLNLKEKTACMIICIDRDEHTIENLTADTEILEGDVLLLAGERDNLATFVAKIAE